MNENMEVGIHSDLQELHKSKPIKKCPRCQSVYLTDKECEACGFQLGFSFIGEPFGHMSFYNLQEHFYRMGSIRKLVYFIREKKYSRYKKYELALKRRLDNLLNYFFDHVDSNDNNRKYFYLELTSLVEEFRKLGIEKYLGQKIKDKVMSSEVDTIACNSIYISKITSWIQHGPDDNDSLKRLLTIKIFGSIRVAYIMLIILFNMILVSVGLMMFPYLASFVQR